MGGGRGTTTGWIGGKHDDRIRDGRIRDGRIRDEDFVDIAAFFQETSYLTTDTIGDDRSIDRR